MGNLVSEMDFMVFFFSAGRPGKPGVFYRDSC